MSEVSRVDEAAAVERPSEDVLAAFRQLRVRTVFDSLKRLEVRNTILQGIDIVSPLALKDQLSIAGTAITVRFVPHMEVYSYVDAPYRVAEIAKDELMPGDIFVIAAGGAPYAFWGEYTTNQAIAQGLQGVIVDGYIREIKAVRSTTFPVYCKGVTPESYVRRCDVVGYNVSVEVAGCQIRPGDVIMGDDDGAIVVPREVLTRVLEVAEDEARLERAMGDALAAGTTWKEIYEDIHRFKFYENGVPPFDGLR